MDYFFLLLLYFSSCDTAVDGGQNLNHHEPNIDNVSGEWESGREIMTRRIIDK